MNFRSRPAGRRIDVIVDVTPLIDVVFLLLIFFMLTTTFVSSPGIDVDLPKAAHSDSRIEASDIIVAVNGEGELIYQQKAVSLDELAALLEERARASKAATVIVQADENVHHGLVVQVMDAAKAAGFGKLAIATQEK